MRGAWVLQGRLHGYDLAKLFYRMGGGLRQSMKFVDLRRMPVVLPPKLAQERIANFLDEKTARIDALIAEKERLLDMLEETWQSNLSYTLQVGVSYGASAPLGWTTFPLKRVCRLIATGRTPSGTRDDCFDVHGLPWVTPSDVKHFSIKDSARRISQLALDDGEVHQYPAGSTLLVGIGATVGKAGHAYSPVSANQQLNILVPDERVIDPEFLTLAVVAAREQVRLAADSATMPIINQEKTGRLLVTIPPLPEQQAIRRRLLSLRSNIDSLLTHVTMHIDLLREYRSSMVSAAVTGQLNIDEFEACQLEAA